MLIKYNQEEVLRNWDVKKEQQKADFMEHLFNVYKPGNHCYTGLWQKFCLGEAGNYCRDMYFQKIAALEAYLKEKEKEKQQKDQNA